MKMLSLFAILLSFQSLANTENHCRVAIKDFDKLLGNNAVLIDQVNREMDKKNISLISTQELSDGDFSIANLVSVDSDLPTNPIYEYVFKTRSSIRLVPCTAVPLCSPFSVEQEVKAIVGLKYKHYYSIKAMKNSSLVEIKSDVFKHKFKEKPTTLLRRERYDGSAEQEDLALALAKEVPKCSKLIKLKK